MWCVSISSVFVKDLDIYQVLPRPYLRSFDGFPGDKLIIKKWLLDLASQAETFFWERIESRIMSDDREKNISQYCTTLKETREGKKILPSTCRIGETIFTSMAVIGGKLYSNHPKAFNHVHKDTKYMVSVIITVGKNISGGDTVFFDGAKTSDLGSRPHILKHLHGRRIFGPFEKVSHEGTIWSEYRAVIYFILTKQIFPHFF